MNAKYTSLVSVVVAVPADRKKSLTTGEEVDLDPTDCHATAEL